MIGACRIFRSDTETIGYQLWRSASQVLESSSAGPSRLGSGIAATVSIGDRPFHDHNLDRDRYRWRNTSGRTSQIAADFRDARVDR
jgi:hypothetical protein